MKTQELDQLETHLSEHIIGQEEAVKETAEILRIGEMGMAEKTRPKGSFLYLGATGVGKTELAVCFTRYLFGDDNLIRLDMSEFQHPDSIYQFLGTSERQGVFQQLLEKTNGQGTILFDEIEKAHPPILDLLLQILDNGRLTLTDGTILDLTAYYIVLTSNIASKAIVKARQQSGAALRRFVENQAQQILRPELFARIDSVQVFNKLTWENLQKIARKLMEQEVKRLKNAGFTFAETPKVENILLSNDWNLNLGVRPMKRMTHRYLCGQIRI